MNGLRDTDDVKNKKNGICGKRCRGSATVEAAVVLPIFIIVLFSLAYIVNIFTAYNVMQSALQSVARNISTASYYYHVSGLKDYSDKLGEMGQGAADELSSQADTIVGAVDSFNSLMSNINDNDPSVNLEVRIKAIGAMGKELAGETESVVTLVKDVLKNPKQEARLLLTVFAQKAAYAVRKELVCLIANLMLEEELKNRAVTGMDAGDTLGIEDISFSQTQIFGDKESLEFITTYTINPPVPFGLIPKLTLSNRVKVIGWTSGRGQSVRVVNEEDPSTGESVWNQMDSESKYWDRGLAIEDLETERLKREAGSMSFMATHNTYPAVDAFIYDENTVKAYDVFTLNPFMQTYQNQPSKIKAEIKKHGKRLMEFDFDNRPDAPKADKKERIVILILPENAREAVSNIDQYIDAARCDLKKIGVSEVRVRYDYGGYTQKTEEEADEENAA